MEDYKPIPVKAAVDIAKGYDKSVVIIVAWDPIHGLLHTTTFGITDAEKQWAATGGEIINKALGGMPALGVTYEDFRKKEPIIQLDEPAPMPPHPCSDPELTSHCSGCTDLKHDTMGGTHQGCTIEHGHVGCNLSDSWPTSFLTA